VTKALVYAVDKEAQMKIDARNRDRLIREEQQRVNEQAEKYFGASFEKNYDEGMKTIEIKKESIVAKLVDENIAEKAAVKPI